ncbi:MAG: lipid A deacylase LpxR family protein [Candidatus Saccharicenans sp.]
MRKKDFISSILFFLLLGFTGFTLLFAQFNPPKKDRGSFSFSLENDVWINQDDGYTNGVQLMWVSPALEDNNQSSFLHFLRQLNLKFLGPVKAASRLNPKIDEEERRASLSLIQAMFTPDCLTEKELIPDDRPYAGLLYASLGLVKLSQRKQDSIGFSAGVVGPWSLAGTIQRWLHKTYGWTYPEGWENQLKNEPILEIWFSRLWTLISPRVPSHGLKTMIKAGTGGQVGNLMTAVQAVLDIKLGLNLKPQMETFTSAPFFNQLLTDRASRTSVYAFLRLEGRAVARNLLLEGNTFQSSPKVEINHLYGQLTAGLAYQSKQAAVLFYWVIPTREFVGQKYRDPYFGLTFSINL